MVISVSFAQARSLDSCLKNLSPVTQGEDGVSEVSAGMQLLAISKRLNTHASYHFLSGSEGDPKL